MDYQEIAKNMIDQLPEDKLIFVINILENIGEMLGIELHPAFTPNQETLDAIAEAEDMIRTGTGERFSGSTEDFFKMLSED